MKTPNPPIVADPLLVVQGIAKYPDLYERFKAARAKFSPDPATKEILRVEVANIIKEMVDRDLVNKFKKELT